MKAHKTLATIRLPGTPYREHIQHIHEWLKPRAYVEIGIEAGKCLALAMKPTCCVGIDPTPKISVEFQASTRIFPITSDDFFAKHKLIECLDNNPLDLAFIDGLHVFEQVLKDFINIEKCSHPNTVVLVHDCMPVNDLTASRIRKTMFWSGDPWKIIPCLIKHRPDLHIAVIPTYPTGLGIITRLDPKSTTLLDQFEKITKDFINVEYSSMGNPRETLNVIDNHTNAVKDFVLSARQQTHKTT